MIVEWLRQQKILTPQEIAEAEDEFRSLSVGQKEEVWQALNDYFIKSPLAADRRFWFSYFRWYAELTWKMLSSVSQEVVASVAFPRQLIMAIVLGFEPVDQLFNYLNERPFEEEEMVGYYAKIREGVLKSGAVIGIVKGREVTYSEIIRELTVITQNNDMLRLAEFTSRLKEVLFPPLDSEMAARYLTDDQDRAVQICMTTLSFFIGVDPSGIWSLVQTALHPEYFAIEPAGRTAPVQLQQPVAREQLDGQTLNAPQENRSAVRTARPASSGAPLQAPEPVAATPVVPTQAATQPPVIPAAPKADASLPSAGAQRPGTPGRPSNKEIRGMVEALFPPNEQSEDERLPKILNLLETLAIRYGDESIRDVYFFNSERGRFEWLS